MAENETGWISGWKLIAKYCDVTVQTVQKYEKKGLPIKRLGKKVFAIPLDMDNWLRNYGK